MNYIFALFSALTCLIGTSVLAGSVNGGAAFTRDFAVDSAEMSGTPAFSFDVDQVVKNDAPSVFTDLGSGAGVMDGFASGGMFGDPATDLEAEQTTPLPAYSSDF